MLSREGTQKVLDSLSQMTGLTGLRDSLALQHTALQEAREGADAAKACHRCAQDELDQVEADLAYSIATNPDLKNEGARKAALDRSRQESEEWRQACSRVEEALTGRDRAYSAVSDAEDHLKTAHALLGVAGAQLRALAALVEHQ